MPILNYLSLAVRDYQESRNWYAINLGLKVEFEVPGDRLAALQDDTGLTIFLQEEEHSTFQDCAITACIKIIIIK